MNNSQNEVLSNSYNDTSNCEEEFNVDCSMYNLSCEKSNGRFVGKFVSDNVVNLSSRKLSRAEISLLSKGLKFVPTPTYLNTASNSIDWS